MRPTMGILIYMLVSCLLYVSVTLPAEATVLEQTFSRLSKCPSNASLAQLTRVQAALNRGSCLSVCAVRLNCSALHHTDSQCYHGNQSQLTNLFTQTVPQSSSPCLSYVKGIQIMMTPSGESATTKAPEGPPSLGSLAPKLLVMFDFRQGFSNLVNPGMFNATPRGSITRDAGGAHFPGSNSDFIEVDTQNGSLASSYLDHPHNFSFYANVVRQTYYRQSYHYFYNCTDSECAGRFGDKNGRAWVEHQFSGQAYWADEVETRESTSAPLLYDGTSQAVSLGAVFYGKTLSNFYMNGTNLPTDADLSYPLHALPLCLRLGHDKESSKSLKGRMICYAIAKAALSTAEFQLLDLMCG